MSSVNMCNHCEDDEFHFDLEVSLQNVRRHLVQMLDDFEEQHCTSCRHLKCCCQCQASLTPPRSPATENGYDFRIIARPVPRTRLTSGQPASSRPTRFIPHETRDQRNRSTSDVESWVRSSTPNPNTTESPGCKPIPQVQLLSSPVPTTIWNEYKRTTPEVNTSSVSLAGNVDDFFKAFSSRMYVSRTGAYEQNQALMQQLKSMTERQKEESEDAASRPD